MLQLDRHLAILFHLQMRSLSSWRAELELENVDVLYIYGFGVSYYEAILPWLHSNPVRTVVFIEDDLNLLDSLFASQHLLLNDPQLFIEYTKEGSHLPHKYPGLQTFVTATLPYAKRPEYRKVRSFSIAEPLESINALD